MGQVDEWDVLPGKGFKGQYRTRRGEVVVWLLQSEQISAVLFYLQRTFITEESPFCFCRPLCIKASALLEKWCHSAVATDIHSVTAELAARVSHCKVLLCESANVCMFMCAVGK